MSETTPLEHDLRDALQGQVRFDRLARTLYSTDASIYEIVPRGVVMPSDIHDIVRTVNICQQHATPIVARGGGTGLTGGAVGDGIQMDFSRFMTGINDIDTVARTVRVQPGVVLETLNNQLKQCGLHFAPDVSTASRATIGGMIANNACGARSVIYGKTCDHVQSLKCVLSDGSVVDWPTSDGSSELARHIESELQEIRNTHEIEIRERFPKTLRNNAGYALDRLTSTPEAPNPVQIICGSEGTLCLVAEAVLRLTPLPTHRALVLIHFNDILNALSAVPAALAHKPAAVELVDQQLLEGARRDAAATDYNRVADTSAAAILIVELFDENADTLKDRAAKISKSFQSQSPECDVREIHDASDQAIVWNMRTRGLGLLMSQPGDTQSYAFVEDTAVPPAQLREYIKQFLAIVKEEGASPPALYAHASEGEIHVRPAINLKTIEGVKRLRRIAQRASELAVSFNGTISGEHGDGLIRSNHLEHQYGPRIMSAFRELKTAFDPDNLLNPGKIVDAPDMTDNLRFGPSYRTADVQTQLDFSAHGGMAGLAEMCSGVGLCRQRMANTMCPSFIATGDELHSTRARANALRIALSNKGLLSGLNDDALHDVMDLCLMCKACKTECPTGVDMARLKVEWLAHRNRTQSLSHRDRIAADAPRLAAHASRFPRTANLLLQSRLARTLAERWFGFDRRIAPPRLATQTFRAWFAKERGTNPGKIDRQTVVLFVDTWTNYYTPQVGIAAVRLLEASGRNVHVPDHACCGRTLISKGLLDEAAHLARENVNRLAPYADMNVPIVGVEPSCILTFTDEAPQLVRSEDARAIAKLTLTIEDFLARNWAENGPPAFRPQDAPLLYHNHCHHKALVGGDGPRRLLTLANICEGQEINAGCCGMAGAFGYEKDHYDVATAIGEERLFPAVRDRDHAHIAVSGFSCRHQISHHTNASPRHIVEYLADALTGD